MIVVSDASPLHYLVLIEQESLLPLLFGRVVAPPAVVAELRRPESPQQVRDWLARRPAWLEIQAASRITASDMRLGAGEAEAEAISLAREIRADLVLLDDRQGVKMARAEGLVVTGTLAVLQAAANRGIIALVDALSALSRTSFHHSPALFDEILRGAQPDDDELP
jgi:predicted nucleic acid-binding protein